MKLEISDVHPTAAFILPKGNYEFDTLHAEVVICVASFPSKEGDPHATESILFAGMIDKTCDPTPVECFEPEGKTHTVHRFECASLGNATHEPAYNDCATGGTNEESIIKVTEPHL